MMPTKRHMTLQRRTEIERLVHQHGSVRVSELAERFDVSEMTIRTDLIDLESKGRLKRDRGGAIPLTATREIKSLSAVEQRMRQQSDQKRLIAREAARLVHPGDTILLDAGTTVGRMLPFLSEVTNLTIITNALDIAMEAGARTSAKILLLGGEFNRESASTLGNLAERTLREMHVPKLFLGTQAFDQLSGLTDTTLEIAHVKQAMIRSARRVILLADSSKWGTLGFIKVAPLSEVHELVSDDGLPEEAQAHLRALGIEVRIGEA